MTNVVRETINNKFYDERLTEYALTLLENGDSECIDSSFEYYRIKYNKYTDTLRIKKLNSGFICYEELIIRFKGGTVEVEEVCIEPKYKSLNVYLAKC